MSTKGEFYKSKFRGGRRKGLDAQIMNRVGGETNSKGGGWPPHGGRGGGAANKNAPGGNVTSRGKVFGAVNEEYPSVGLRSG